MSASLPKQVVQQQQEIEALEKQLYAQEAPVAQPVEEPTAAPAPVAEEKPTPAPEVPPAEKPVDWEQKYRTLQGMFDSQVPQLHKQNKELVSQLQDLQQRVTAMQEAKPAATPDALVTDKDRETFGEDLIDVQRRVAQEVMREYVNPLKAELATRDSKIAELEAKLQRTGGEVATMTFEQRLAQAVPDFSAVNADPAWISWLDEADPYTGEPRRLFAERAYHTGDVDTVKRVVDIFKATTAPATTKTQRQVELERQVAPTRAAGASSAPAEPRIYTDSEVARLFDKVRTLNMRGEYDEAAKLESELSLAYQQGRVRG